MSKKINIQKKQTKPKEPTDIVTTNGIKVEGVHWINTLENSLAIVCGTDTTTNEKKMYFGQIFGIEVEHDVNHVCAYGAKIQPEMIKELAEFYELIKEDNHEE